MSNNLKQHWKQVRKAFDMGSAEEHLEKVFNTGAFDFWLVTMEIIGRHPNDNEGPTVALLESVVARHIDPAQAREAIAGYLDNLNERAEKNGSPSFEVRTMQPEFERLRESTGVKDGGNVERIYFAGALALYLKVNGGADLERLIEEVARRHLDPIAARAVLTHLSISPGMKPTH